MPLDAYIEAHRTDPVRATFWLVEVRFPVVQRLTDCDQPIVYDGHTFAPAPLTVEGVSDDAAGTAAGSGGVTIGAGDDYWPTLLAALAEGERHPEVAVYEAWLNTSTKSPTPAAVRLVRTFRIEGAEWTPLEARLTLGPSADATTGRLPFRDYGGAVCTYREAGGPQCGAPAAAAGCARTPAACTAFANLPRFGGLLNLPAEEAEVRWMWQTPDGQLYEQTLTLRRRAE